MENRAHALIVGLFTLLLGTAAVASFWWFSGGAQDTRSYLIVTTKGVAGLNPQAAVRYRGVRVGKVVKVDLSDALEVNVLIRVDSAVPVTRGTRARIASQGLTGQGYVALDDDGLDPTPARPLAPGLPPVIAMQEASAISFNEGTQELLSRLRRSTERLDQVLSEENVTRLNQTLVSLSASAASLEQAMRQTAALATDLRRFSSAENAEHLTASLQEIQHMSSQLGPAVTDFRRALGRVEAAGARIDRVGETLQAGLTGETLPRVNQLVGELQASTQQLTRVLDDVERNPQILLGGRTRELGPGEVKQ
ncbi:MAG: hypothetical protein CGU28_10635 [Candidatus Dactylopiibacterium carminicum]|nr:MlaD family protein [Candidatus Dactylopiibacterium carminicum]PAS95938.1 MAG: hypothetical protein CGU28_10635 [Candidatus Dactylopiibacterium carminicum]PAS99431.1 MAG: hypothetical protein BSR46_08195 [Candidatus Dactylopiibacterium carminicum]